MKILTDFDGVLTDQTREALRVLELYSLNLSKICRIPLESAQNWVRRAESKVLEIPEKTGWQMDGRLSAFSNEDLFIKAIGISSYMDSQVSFQKEWQTALDLLQEAGYPSFAALNHHCYTEMTQETSRGKLKPMDSEATSTLHELIDKGFQIVIVSNSHSERIKELLRSEFLSESSCLKVRGNARKFVLGGLFRKDLSYGEYLIPTDRPHYASILLEETPDIVIGDVFSLDLALPFSMAKDAAGISELYLRTRDYTPQWALNLMSEWESDRPKLSLLSRFSDLPGLIND